MLNIVALNGRCVADPELRKTPAGISTTTFTIAVDRSYVKPGTERQTDFIDIVAWRGTAEFACKYFRKGQLIAVNGSLQTRSYENKEGRKVKVWEVVADNLHFAESKNSRPAANSEYNENEPDIQEDEPQAYRQEDYAVIDDSEDLPF